MTTSKHLHPLAVAAAAGVLSGAVVVLVAGVVTGSSGAAGAALGAFVTLAVFAFGAGSVDLASRIQPRAALVVALVTYGLQVVVLVAFFAGLRRSGLLGESLEPRWLAVAVVVVTLTWTALQIVAWQRRGTPVETLATGGEG
jgi:ATP synthase protein I